MTGFSANCYCSLYMARPVLGHVLLGCSTVWGICFLADSGSVVVGLQQERSFRAVGLMYNLAGGLIYELFCVLVCHTSFCWVQTFKAIEFGVNLGLCRSWLIMGIWKWLIFADQSVGLFLRQSLTIKLIVCHGGTVRLPYKMFMFGKACLISLSGAII